MRAVPEELLLTLLRQYITEKIILKA